MNAVATNEVAAVKERVEDLRREIGRVYVGSGRASETMLVAILARGHILLEGVPGVAKTTLVKAFASALGCSTRRIQFTPDLLPADITGTYVLSPRDGTFSLRAGPIFANVVLATQNPIDLEGTYPLPEAQIDRFLVRVPMGYPSAREEAQMLRLHGVEVPIVRPVLKGEDVLRLQGIAARIHVEDDLHDYAVALTHFTRTHSQVALGASPRATLGLLQASKARALVDGRPFVVPEDLRAVAPSVLAHRLVLSADLEGDSRARDQIVEEALNKVSYRRGARAV